MKFNIFKRKEKKDNYQEFESFTSKKTSRNSNGISRLFKSIRKRFPKIKLPSTLGDIFTNKEILTKLAVTIFIIIIYRILSAVPLPGINMQAYTEAFGSASPTQAQYLFTIFTGGRLDTPSIIGLGLAAYINSSIIMQLLPYAITRLKQLQQEGERGRQIINQITRFLTVPLAFLYSIAYLLLISQQDINAALGKSGAPLYLISPAVGSSLPTIMKILFMALVLAGGTVLLMWLAEIVTEKGIGNGSSIIIALGILSSLPALVQQDLSKLNIQATISQVIQGNILALNNPLTISIILTFIGFVLVIAAIVFINESQRQISIQYARRVRGEDTGRGSFLPIKFTVTGVMPVIFAYALLSLPQLLIPIIKPTVISGSFIEKVVTSLESSFLFAQTPPNDQILNANDLVFEAIYFVLIILFGLFYSFIVLNPKETAENLQKSGAFVPGIRPGKSTENYMSAVLLRIGFVGAAVLAIIAIIPFIGRNLILNATSQNLALLSGIGGTSILILVGVLLDTKRQVDSLRATRNYQKYIN